MYRYQPHAALTARPLTIPRFTPHTIQAPATPLQPASRYLHTSPQHHSSPLFHLASLSNSRESQWFTKASGLSPVEHSPNLQLIRSSEVHPFQPRPNTAAARPKRTRPSSRSSSTTSISSSHPNAFILSTRDVKALGVGREILQRGSEHIARLQRSLRQEKRVSANANEALQKEIGRLSKENKSATVGILLAVGAATAVATWKTWPANGVARAPRTQLAQQNTGGRDGNMFEPVSVQTVNTAGRNQVAIALPVAVSEPPIIDGRSLAHYERDLEQPKPRNNQSLLEAQQGAQQAGRRPASSKTRQDARASIIAQPMTSQSVPPTHTSNTRSTGGWHSWFWNSA